MECTELLSILTSWGVIQITFRPEGVVGCTLPRRDSIPREPFAVLDAGTDIYSRYVRGLLEGGNPERPPVGSLQGTPFQIRVWQALLDIPIGHTRSYSDLAEAIGRPSACRAVANACGRNPVPLFIPCHRIIRTDGNPGGFTAGIAWKSLLLAVEQSNRF